MVRTFLLMSLALLTVIYLPALADSGGSRVNEIRALPPVGDEKQPIQLTAAIDDDRATSQPSAALKSSRRTQRRPLQAAIANQAAAANKETATTLADGTQVSNTEPIRFLAPSTDVRVSTDATPESFASQHTTTARTSLDGSSDRTPTAPAQFIESSTVLADSDESEEVTAMPSASSSILPVGPYGYCIHYNNYATCECHGYQRHSYKGQAHFFKERPFGDSLRSAMRGQVVRGIADQLVLYHYDFEQGADRQRLTARGHYQLKKYLALAMQYGLPIVIESIPNDQELSQRRRLYVGEQIKIIEPAASVDMIVVGRPAAVGLRGVEAAMIDANNLRQASGGNLGLTLEADAGK